MEAAGAAGAAVAEGAAADDDADVAEGAAAVDDEWTALLHRSAPPAPASPVDRYLAANTADGEDAVAWWYARRHHYGWLAEQAIRLLLAFPTSTEVERVFSHGRHLAPHLRARLAPPLLEALLRLRF